MHLVLKYPSSPYIASYFLNKISMFLVIQCFALQLPFTAVILDLISFGIEHLQARTFFHGYLIQENFIILFFNIKTI